jgi:hypothetical protein
MVIRIPLVVVKIEEDHWPPGKNKIQRELPDAWRIETHQGLFHWTE